MRAIEGAVGAMSAYELLALAFVAVIVVAVMVASRAAFTALRARYPRQLNIAGSLLLLHGFVLVLLALDEHTGSHQSSCSCGADLQRVIAVVAAASVLATVYLFWTVLAERLLTPRQACGALLVSAAFGAAWVTAARAAGVPLSGDARERRDRDAVAGAAAADGQRPGALVAQPHSPYMKETFPGDAERLI